MNTRFHLVVDCVLLIFFVEHVLHCLLHLVLYLVCMLCVLCCLLYSVGHFALPPLGAENCVVAV